MGEQTDFWHVRLPNGSVCTLTLDELDDAFQAGQIDESVYVLHHGADAWTTLGALLGIETAPPPPRVPPARVASVAAPATPVSGYAATVPSAFSPTFETAGTMRPMVSEIDLDDFDFGRPKFRSSGKRKFTLALGVAGLALAGVAFAYPNRAAAAWSRATSFFSTNFATSHAAARPPVANVPPPPAEVAPPPAQPNTTAQPNATPVSSASATQSDADRLSDEKKRALLEADKARAEADKARAAQHQARDQARTSGAAAARHGNYKSEGKTVFHKGGNKYDPLNSSL